MAYGDGDFRVNVRGMNGLSEQFSNTWSFEHAGGGGDIQDAVDHLHTFYDDLYSTGNLFSSDWHAVGATVKDLFLGDTFDATWAQVDGATNSLAPTQLAARISLSAFGNVHGGPFLCGFGTPSIEQANGLIDNLTLVAISTNFESMLTNLDGDGWALMIDRPTISELVPLTAARLGTRFDVIRKRGNDTAEAYISLTLPQVATFRPGKPRARLTLAASYAPGTGVHNVVFDTVVVDGDWTTAGPSSVVVARAGLYLFTLALSTAAAGVNSALTARIETGGVIVAGNVSASVAGQNVAACAWMAELAVGTTVTFVESSVAATKQLLAGSCSAMAVRIGPVRWT